jgi:hypothetical protein
MGRVDLKDLLLHSYVIGKKRMNKWYMKLFYRLLNTSILNAIIIYRNSTGKRTVCCHSEFVKYVNVLDQKVPGQHSSDSTVPQLTKTIYKQASTF